jgi:hypothetical protein
MVRFHGQRTKDVFPSMLSSNNGRFSSSTSSTLKKRSEIVFVESNRLCTACNKLMETQNTPFSIANLRKALHCCAIESTTLHKLSFSFLDISIRCSSINVSLGKNFIHRGTENWRLTLLLLTNSFSSRATKRLRSSCRTSAKSGAQV